MFAIYNENAIFGIGETTDAARADLAQWVNAEDAASDEWKIAPMTKALARQVTREGGCISFGEIGGKLCTLHTWDRLR